MTTFDCMVKLVYTAYFGVGDGNTTRILVGLNIFSVEIYTDDMINDMLITQIYSTHICESQNQLSRGTTSIIGSSPIAIV